jgi:hypothetical protein
MKISVGLIADQKKLAARIVEVLEELSALYHLLEDPEQKEQVKKVHDKLADLIEIR